MRRILLIVLAAAIGIEAGCSRAPTRGRGSDDASSTASGGGNGAGPGGTLSEEIHAARRHKMVETQIRARGIENERVLEAMRKVPRHLLVPESVRESAYEDSPLPIGEEQTISQPFIVALMTQLADPGPGQRVLEVGTGSGYQAAVLAEMGAEVYTIEIVAPLGERAAALLRDLGYGSVRTRIGDGYRGWPEAAPFDAILVTAAPDRIPQPLKEQLREGGRLVIPVGTTSQELVRITRTASGFEEERVAPVRFVPMTGEAEERR